MVDVPQIRAVVGQQKGEATRWKHSEAWRKIRRPRGWAWSLCTQNAVNTWDF